MTKIAVDGLLLYHLIHVLVYSMCSLSFARVCLTGLLMAVAREFRLAHHLFLPRLIYPLRTLTK